MPIAAVPNYLQERDSDFYLSAPPGHRFLSYFCVWGENQETGKIEWRMTDRAPKIDKKTKQQKVGKSGRAWEDLPNDQFACTIAACKTPQYDEEKPRARKPKTDPGLKPWKPLMESLLVRQTATATQIVKDALLRLDAVTTAPFATGLGNEHPLENGFAFLNPYGLPYLPGSGLKGVLRQAARELASGEWGETQGWSEEKNYTLQVGRQRIALSVIDVLFGLESGDGDTEHVRGTLCFWDVIPQIVGDSLMVEIMTPHQSHYYQQKPAAGSTNPHDSGSPNPICFLTVPPGSGFTFFVPCDIAHLQRLTASRSEDARDPLVEGDTHWKTLLARAFEHAFAWLGFGAKTAVGYGAMMAADAVSRSHENRPEPEARRSAASTAPTKTAAETRWESAQLKFILRNGTLTAIGPGRAESYAYRPNGEELLRTLPAALQKKLRNGQPVTAVAVVSGRNLLRVEVPGEKA